MAAVTTRVPKLPGWMTLAEAADELKLTRSGVHKMKSILETIHFVGPESKPAAYLVRTAEIAEIKRDRSKLEQLKGETL
jgi:hypothetical protein